MISMRRCKWDTRGVRNARIGRGGICRLGVSIIQWKSVVLGEGDEAVDQAMGM